LGAKDFTAGRVSQRAAFSACPDMEHLEAEIDVDFQFAAAVSCLTLENTCLMVTSATFGEARQQ